MATLALAMGFGLAKQWRWVILSILLGMLWWFGLQHHKEWVASLLFVLFAGTCAAGLFLRVPSPAMLIALVAILSAWDLHDFLRRVGDREPDEHTATLVDHHLKQLLIVDVAGSFAAVGALLLSLKLYFILVAVMVLLLVLSLHLAFRFLRPKSPAS